MKTILVIDDERNIVELLRLYLEKEGWAVIAAGDGESGLELHRRHEPDLVILDLMLPRIDGFEVCRELRRRGDTPILMLTGAMLVAGAACSSTASAKTAEPSATREAAAAPNIAEALRKAVTTEASL